ncbi:MAG TPA: amino acid ABC transporter substrate-binding protein, partial [Candidatus Polarisedimenticolia bacterium]|nr:amino acid ABC transporter substrate-binding protein [Candidatus Polarisedimenticolia bacterium]
MAIAFLGALIQPFAQAATDATGTLDRVRQTGKLTFGYNPDARPFSYKDESGNAAGFAVALCQK